MEENDNFLYLLKKENKDKLLNVIGKKLKHSVDEWCNVLTGLPYFSSIINLWKIGVTISDRNFIEKVIKFLEAGTYSPEEFDTFYNKLDQNQIEKIASFLVNTLSAIDENEKATVIGYIYKYRVKGNIDDDLMIRLCAIVNRAHLGDLKLLPQFVTKKTTNEFQATNLFILGLLKNKGANGAILDSSDPEKREGGSIYILNVAGEKLNKILKEEKWYDPGTI